MLFQDFFLPNIKDFICWGDWIFVFVKRIIICFWLTLSWFLTCFSSFQFWCYTLLQAFPISVLCCLFFHTQLPALTNGLSILLVCCVFWLPDIGWNTPFKDKSQFDLEDFSLRIFSPVHCLIWNAPPVEIRAGCEVILIICTKGVNVQFLISWESGAGFVQEARVKSSIIYSQQECCKGRQQS